MELKINEIEKKEKELEALKKDKEDKEKEMEALKKEKEKKEITAVDDKKHNIMGENILHLQKNRLR